MEEIKDLNSITVHDYMENLHKKVRCLENKLTQINTWAEFIKRIIEEDRKYE